MVISFNHILSERRERRRGEGKGEGGDQRKVSNERAVRLILNKDIDSANKTLLIVLEVMICY